MKQFAHSFLILLPLAFGGALQPACAHYLWVESPKGAPVLYFGEYDEKLHERSPGRLDEIRSPRAWTVQKGERRELSPERQAERFVLRGARTRSVVVEETGHAVRDWTQFGVGIVKPIFYARYLARPERAVPALTLDVLPADGRFDKLAVYFKGTPLAKAKLEVYAPNGWKQEHRTDENGRVALRLPWPGHYVVEVTHLERTAGEFEGKAYEALRHRATLTFPLTHGERAMESSAKPRPPTAK
ncbi:MAG: hypothetical protein HY017_24135 [Betaproteobacteria bacterium]|nr:hypothetical protein [Betaproteobacteria bacterium]